MNEENKNENDNKKSYLKYVLHVAILLGVVWAGIKYVNGEEVINALEQFNYRLAPVMLALALATLLLKAARFQFLLQPFAPHITWTTGIKAYVAGQGATVLPGGVAARAGLLKQIGVPVSEGSVPVLANSAFDQVFFISLGLIAALWYPEARLPGLIILGVLAVAALLYFFKPSREWLAHVARRIADKVNVLEEWENFLDALPQILTKKILLAGFITTALAFASFIIVLRLAFQGMGVSVSYPVALLAYIVPTMLGRMVPIPAGLGVTEATMVGFLATAAGVDTNAGVAGVAIFRIATIFFPILVGAIIYFIFWRGEDENSTNSPEAEPVETAHASNLDI